MGKAKKAKKAMKSKSKSRKVAGPKGGGLVKKAASVGMSLVGGASPAPSRARGGGGGRRRRGPEYWAKKVLVERLKKKYWRAKYGGR